MKLLQRISLSALLAAGISWSSLPLAAQTAGQTGSFSGTVSSYDASANTLQVNGATYQVLPTSRITKENQAAASTALASGQHVEGSYKESAEGKREVLTMNITQSLAENRQSGKFEGEIAAYNSSANTIRVKGETYQLLPTSRITQTQARIAPSALAAGQTVEGQFKESAEGKREVITMNVSGNGNASDTSRSQASLNGNASNAAGTAFKGNVDRVDRDAQTFTINNQTYQLLPTSRMVGPQGASVQIARLQSNQNVEGTYKESAGGKREVLTLNILDRGNTAAGGSQGSTGVQSGASFQGNLDRIHRDTRTFTINDQTYQVLPTTRIVGRNGAAVDMSALQPNQHVQGTFKESEAGKREVLSLEIGRQ